MSDVSIGDETFTPPTSGEVWQHYKGGQYWVMKMGIWCDTDEPCVLYKDAIDPFGQIFVRSLKSWQEIVTAADGRRPRFVKVTA